MEERYYALDKFSELEQELLRLYEIIPIKRTALDKYMQKEKKRRANETYMDLQVLHQKLLSLIRSVQLLFSECDIKESADFCNKFYAAAKGFNILTKDYGKFLSLLKSLIEQIPKNATTNNKIIGRLMNNVKMGYYPTDIAHVRMIKEALVFPDRKINILDPCCGEGMAIAALGENQNATTYGIELDEARGAEAENRVDRVGFGSYFYSHISQNAFHLLFLNPPYLNVMTDSGTNARSEKRFLVDSMNNLMIGGIMVYIIPYHRLTWDICRVLCDNFRDISIYRFLDGEFEKFKQIVVMGVKKKKEDGEKQAEELSQYAMMPERIPMIDTIPKESYIIPDVDKRVERFCGAVFNLGELGRQMAQSKSMDILFEKSNIDLMEKRPLLPFNIGQIGLIGGSGLINGYVDCDCPHIIKGRVIKEVKSRESPQGDSLTETRVNRMIFNVLTQDGVKRLA